MINRSVFFCTSILKYFPLYCEKKKIKYCGRNHIRLDKTTTHTQLVALVRDEHMINDLQSTGVSDKL
jgi:hypothetical protein